MSRLFAVTRSRGPAWNYSLSLEQQADWPGHADFMNALHAEGFVLLGGPLEGTSDVLLIIRANEANEIHDRLSADSWTSRDLLRIKQIVPWTLRLGSLSANLPGRIHFSGNPVLRDYSFPRQGWSLAAQMGAG